MENNKKYIVEKGILINGSIFIEDNGILTSNIQVEYDKGGIQGYGGYSLDRYDKEKGYRVKTEEGELLIQSLCDKLNINSLDELKEKNKKVFVLKEKGFNGLIKGISLYDRIDFHSFEGIIVELHNELKDKNNMKDLPTMLNSAFKDDESDINFKELYTILENNKKLKKEIKNKNIKTKKIKV